MIGSEMDKKTDVDRLFWGKFEACFWNLNSSPSGQNHQTTTQALDLPDYAQSELLQPKCVLKKQLKELMIAYDSSAHL